MENLEGFSSFPVVEQAAATLILLCATFCHLKSEMESLEGFRFYPTNKKIIHFLHEKRLNPLSSNRYIKDIDDICSLEPWDLPRESDTESDEQFWYFFYEPKYKYKQSKRVNRRTNAGSWTITGKCYKIKAKNGLTGSKKILTFYRHGPESKKEKTEWVMHEFHVQDHPNYKKELVFCRIKRKRDNKHGVLTPDEGQDQSSQQLVSPPIQLLPSDHLISGGNHIQTTTVTNPQPPLLPNHNLISIPDNHFVQNTLSNPQLLPNDYPISYPGNHIHQNSLSNTLPDHNLVSCPGNHIVQNILSNPQLLSNHNLISNSGNHIDQNTLTNPEIQTDHNLIFYPKNHCDINTLITPEILPNHNLISFPRNHIEDNIFTGWQVPSNYTYQILDENHLLGEFNSGGGYNGLHNASFSTLQQSPIYPVMGLSYSNSSIDNGDLLNSHIDNEQVNSLINLQRACQDENSLEETGQTHTPDFKSSKSDGSAYAEGSSDPDTETYHAWFNDLLQNIA